MIISSAKAKEKRTRRDSRALQWSAGINKVAKRFTDVFASFLGLLFLSPLFGFLAVLIKLDTPGPVFFKGKRAGRYGRPFNILKFRTMYERPESYQGPKVTGNGDHRITRVGQWLRDTKLNELPQLFNILKGEMSLVGPRPEDVEIVQSWPKKAREKILSLRPGITSPASIIYRDEEQSLNPTGVLDEYLSTILPDKLRLDQLYVANHSFLSDLDVILWTLVMLIPVIKRVDISEKRLYVGPFYRFIRRYFSWFVLDLITVFVAVGIAGVLWRSAGPLDIGWEISVGIAIFISLLFSIINARLGLQRISWRQAKPAYSLDLAFSSFVTTLVLISINALLGTRNLFPQGLLALTGFFSFWGFLIVRYRDRLLTGLASRWLWYRRRAGTIGEKVLIVGAGEASELAIWLLEKSKFASAFSVIGMVDDNLFKQDVLIDGYPVLGTTSDLPELAKKWGVDLVLYAISNIQPEEQERILALCRKTSARLVIIPDLLEMIRVHFIPASEEGAA